VVQAEVEAVLGSRLAPTMADYGQLRYVMRCVNESMRLYPHPPVLLRRALVEDELPGGYKVRPRWHRGGGRGGGPRGPTAGPGS
jgi:carotene epsilon-monooxygenase